MKAILVAISIFAFQAQAKEAKSAEAQAVNQACATDAATAGCGSEKVGTGLVRCLIAYRKGHKGYKFAPACKSAMKAARAAKGKGA